MTPTKPKTRTQLDRSDWIEAAIDVLATEGLEGLRVEVLAKAFGVTKGSFYWHFKDRQDLLEAVLETWKEGRIKDIVKQTNAIAGKELDQIRHVFDTYSLARNQRGMSIELAVRDWARHDPKAAAVVAEVDRWRLDCSEKLFVACGLSERDAKSRSLLLYAYLFGTNMMVCDNYDTDMTELRKRIAEYVAARPDEQS